MGRQRWVREIFEVVGGGASTLRSQCQGGLAQEFHVDIQSIASDVLGSTIQPTSIREYILESVEVFLDGEIEEGFHVWEYVYGYESV